MKPLYDFRVDEADDILLGDGDIAEENNLLVNIIRCAERRVSARYDDFLIDGIAAGLERFLNGNITSATKSNIEEVIRSVLVYDDLLANAEFDVFILDETDTGKLPIIIKFKFNQSLLSSPLSAFKVLVNLRNQRSYR